MQNQDNAETNVTLVILDHTYIFTPHNVTRIPPIVHHCIPVEVHVENGPYTPQELVTGQLVTSVGDWSSQSDGLWQVSAEEEGPFLPDELAT